MILFFGVLLLVSDRVLAIGRLPGDITVRGDGWTIIAPLVTAIVLSVGTAVLSLVAWMRR
jgi:Mg2+/citrate symporter